MVFRHLLLTVRCIRLFLDYEDETLAADRVVHVLTWTDAHDARDDGQYVLSHVLSGKHLILYVLTLKRIQQMPVPPVLNVWH